MTDRNVVRGHVMPRTSLDGSNTRGYYARLRACAVTLGLGPLLVLVLAFVLRLAPQWPAEACVAFAAITAGSARASQIVFLWARLD